jgi:hypothetical protein
LLHNGTPVTVANGVFAASFVGSRTVTADFSVAAPVQPTSPNDPTPATQDSVTVKLATETPVDLKAIDWNPSIAYTSAEDKDGQPKDVVTKSSSPSYASSASRRQLLHLRRRMCQM